MATFSDLHELNQVWAERLKSDECPPILGLAPLSDREVETVTKIVTDLFADQTVGYRFDVLLSILQRFPAVMALWLARKAGEAYEFGAFWEQFSAAIGVRIPTNNRASLARRFRRACFVAMHDWVAPPDSGAWVYVGEFLFQAGLPLSHCRNFARHMRKCERRTGLPDPEDVDAGEYLRDLLLESMRPEMLPVLKRSLQSHAGAYICDVALRVVLAGRFDGVNPSLGKELAAAFEHETRTTLRRAARQPFMRLAEDLCSLEVVGPSQDHRLISDGGVSWVVNGTSYRHNYSEPFVFPIQDEPRIVVELRGLRHSQMLLRTYVADLYDRDFPFMLFSADTRKVLSARPNERNEVNLPGGECWLVHTPELRVVDGAENYPWVDGHHVSSFLRLTPSSQTELMSDDGTSQWVFRVSAVPFIDIAGESVISDEGMRIHYGWEKLPEVWLPTPEDDEDAAQHWTLTVKTTSREWALPLCATHDAEQVTAWTKCKVTQEDVLGELRPGLHRLQFSIDRLQRTRLRHEVLLWTGLLEVHPGDRFVMSALPENLVHERCPNFQVSAREIRHTGTHVRQGTLCFAIDEQLELFHWSRKGVFLESFEKRPGQDAVVEPAELGAAFSAAPTSRRWLRIWPFPRSQAEIRVNKQTYLQTSTDSHQRFFDVSLASLATRCPKGGRVVLHSADHPPIDIARFTPPLVPQRLESLEQGASVIFHFSDRVPFVRPVMHEITRGERIEGFELQPQLQEDSFAFAHESAPTVVWEELSTHDFTELDLDHPGSCIRVSAKLDGNCRSGMWMIEFEARRDEEQDWQLITGKRGHRIPAIVNVRPEGVDDFRSVVFWSALDARREHLLDVDETVFQEHETELPELLCQVFGLIQLGFSRDVAEHFVWLENLCCDLSRVVSKTLRQQESAEVQKLLFLASGDRKVDQSRSLFVSVPGLLALESNRYNEVSKANPLSSALNWCGKLAGYDHVIQAVGDCTAGLLDGFEVLMRFNNFNPVMQEAQAAHERDARPEDDFAGFDHICYWDRCVGPIAVVDPLTEWNGRDHLGAEHATWGIAALIRRRNREADDDQFMGQVAWVLNLADDLREFLRDSLGPHRAVMSPDAWQKPWLRVDVQNDYLTNCCVRFASLFALAARASGANWLEFQRVMEWLNGHAIASGSSERALATLVGMAPELFGYYLMFWELMVRTYPHA